MSDLETWYLFRCNMCGWSTPGTFNFKNDPALIGACPDSDCPKCGSHDSVIEGEEIAAPNDIAAVISDCRSGPYAK